MTSRTPILLQPLSAPRQGARATRPVPAPIVDVSVPRPIRREVPLAATALTILAALLLGFLGYLLVLSPVVHARAQSLAYADLREQLANAVAPLGQTRDGALLPLGSPVALLELPGSDVREVIREGTTSGVLAGGPGHRRDTVLPGQAGSSVVFGRRAAYGGPFSGLGDLRPGQRLSVITGQGRQDFRVIGVRRAGDPLPAPLAAGAARLTLVTASGPAYVPDGTLRVDADLIGPVQPAGPRPLTAALLGSAESPLQGDPSVLTTLVLWGQALALGACGVVWARVRWGLRQAWVVGVPLLTGLGLAVAHSAAQLLPNLL